MSKTNSGSGIGIANLPFVEQAYEDWLRDPGSVSADLGAFFQEQADPAAGSLQPVLPSPTLFGAAGATTPRASTASTAMATSDAAVLQERVERLVRTFRLVGHSTADLDPLGRARPDRPELGIAYHGLDDQHLGMKFPTRYLSPDPITLQEILQRLQDTYCRTIGVQHMHIDNLEIRHWLEEAMEGTCNRIALSRDDQVRILSKLTDAQLFEQFIQKKFPGMKSFSLEGGETLIPLLDQIVEEAAEKGVVDVVIGMAHRGRLNVLANIMDKHPREIFREFMDLDAQQYLGRGDVKYHMGYSSDRETRSGKKVHLSLCFNPSHLECVGPVVAGRVRAKQLRRNDAMRKQVAGIVIHGDAAIAGQGVNQELFNMSELAGYRTGGTIHIVVNNQIGFTTLPERSRSTTYCTEIARMLQIPIFHVNGEDPEGVAQVVHLATEFRDRFAKDVVIDMYCYRKHGHNEGDEPFFTQPQMYEIVKQKQSVRDAYLQRLLNLGDLSNNDANSIDEERRTSGVHAKAELAITETGAIRIVKAVEERLEEELARSETFEFVLDADAGLGPWRGYMGGNDVDVPEVSTAIDPARLKDLIEQTTRVPDGFTLHKKIARIYDARRKMAAGERPFDWGGAETAAFASLLDAGHPIRISGQDCGRGTFSHRHAEVHEQTSNASHIPLQHLAEDQGHFDVFNSPLTEVAVLGFEYGYSLDAPDGLNIWEAQFGDFANVAQVIIDQFISSGEDKWFRLSGLTMLLPHGFEGQGPEHSSARLERYLSLCALDNMQVVNLTTPAQVFHCLRRQVLRSYRKPLIVMSPKSLLRHPEATSTLDELTNGEFQRVIADNTIDAPKKVKRIVLCSGKLYYELKKARGERRDVALVRLEQIYPESKDALAGALEGYPKDCPVVWAQEEPWNMGAWHHLHGRWGETLYGHPVTVAARRESASPATGSASSHRIEQQALIEEALGHGD